MSLKNEAYEFTVAQIVAQLGKDGASITEDTNLEADLGFKSINYNLLSAALEDEFEVDIAYMDLKRCATLGDVADFIVSALEG